MDRFDHLELTVPAETQRPEAELRAAPKDGPSFYRAARRMRESGLFETAARYYERAVGFDDQNYTAWVELIDSLLRAGRLEQAQRISHEALDAYRQVRLLYASRALVLAYAGAFNEAAPLSDISLEGDEAHWYPRCVRAEILLRASRDNREQAVQFLDQAIEAAPSLWEPYFVGGCMLLAAQWPALAAGFLSEAIHRKPTAVAGLLCLGDAFHALRLYEQALFYYQKATELEPTHEPAMQRQRTCAPSLYGLTRVFAREDLRRRWNKEFEKLVTRWEPTVDDF